jgi:soluble lytic murein transglycosylase-like protein
MERFNTVQRGKFWLLTSVVMLLAVVMLALPTPREAAVSPVRVQAASVVPVQAQQEPLTPSDNQRYRAIFAAQDRGDFTAADTMLGAVDSQLLLGHVLAQRYLHDRYRSEVGELSAWLDNFSDHPQAQKIATLANRRGAEVTSREEVAPLKGAGYIDHLGAKSMPSGWYHGLALWRAGDYAKAAPQFATLAAKEDLSPWHRSAAYFWAYRSYDRLSDRRARHMLEFAAEYPTTFYGMLASRTLQNSTAWMASAPYVPSALRRQPAVLRAQALASIGRETEAEAELRQLFPRLSRHERKALVTLASQFNLPNLQVRLSQMKDLSPSEALFASYPMPGMIAKVQNKVDPAIIFAISRQESGFRPHVASTAGAVGMMQMLPSTADHVFRSLDETELASVNMNGLGRPHLTDTETNVRLGAAYIQMLMDLPAVNHSLIHALAAYNAGPGTVAGWQRAAANISDPLLYIESIPYGETRNYVVQVLAHYWVYQHLMGEPARSLDLLAIGQWPVYQG